MTALVHSIMPGPDQALGLAALLVTLAAWSVLGALAGGGKRIAEADLVCGFGAAAAVFTAFGVAGPYPFSVVAYGLIVLAVPAVVALWRWRSAPLGPAAARMIAISLPLIALVAAMVPSQWDEFTHWLPNARYLFENDTFPRAGLPASPSVYPAYPYGMAFPIYAASRLAHVFAENTGALFNLFLLLSFGLVLARQVATGLAGDAGSPARLGWGFSAIGFLAVTAFNPVFVPKIVFTAYADSATTVTLGTAAVLGCLMLDRLARGDDEAPRRLAVQIALASTALIALKQVNLVLLASLFAGLALIALRDPRVRFGRFVLLSLAALALPIAVWVLWRIHVRLNMPGGEFLIRPFAEWSIDLAPDVLARMALVLSKKGGYLAIMLISVGFAVWALRRPRTALDRLAIVCATLFVAYNGFLLFTYLVAFGTDDALRVASFWRYNTHLGGVTVAFAAEALVVVWLRYRPAWSLGRAGALAAVVAFALPLALTGKLRFDNRPPKLYVRSVARDMAPMLTRTDRLALLDAGGDGTYAMIVRYGMEGSAPVVGFLTGPPGPTAEAVRGAVGEWHASHIWVHVATPAIEDALGVTLPRAASTLLARGDGGWRIAKSWPYPGYALPMDLPD